MNKIILEVEYGRMKLPEGWKREVVEAADGAVTIRYTDEKGNVQQAVFTAEARPSRRGQ